MKLAQESQKTIEQFFREYLDEKDFALPKIYFFAGKFSAILSKVLQIQGITFGRNIVLSPHLIFIGRNEKKIISKSLIVHEIAHVLQYRREGFLTFLMKYFYAYWKNLRKKRDWTSISRHEAYLEIPFEVEARKIASDFVKWYKKTNF